MNTKTLEFLKTQVPLFKGVKEEDIASLIKVSRIATYDNNESIIEFGEEGKFLGVMIEGNADASFADDSGARHTLLRLNPGDVFGEISLMTGDKTIADVIATEHAKVLLIPQAAFATLIATNLTVLRYISQLISSRARKKGAHETQRADAAFRKNEDPYGFSLHTDRQMKLLVINCGSSSLKYNLYDTADETKVIKGMVDRIGSDSTVHTCQTPGGEMKEKLPKGGHEEALTAVLGMLTSKEAGILKKAGDIKAVGHRVVHGGEKFTGSVVINDDVLAEIERLSELAPLHNPVNVAGIKAAMKCLKGVPQVAVFDTAFHQTLPPYAYLYGLPYELYEQKKIRRYGFHGTSHLYVSLKAAQFLKRPFNALEIISCHLGNGASLCAIDHGRSIDTTMGLTPVEGLIMGTRSGDVDPGALLLLLRQGNGNVDELDNLLNRKSGLLGLSGISNDMRDIQKAAAEGNPRALLAIKAYCYRIRKYIGAFGAAMQGLDAVVFTGGVGQGSAGVRSLACQGLGYMGVKIDEKKNRDADGFASICDISADGSAVRTIIVPTDEERMIARETIRVLNLRYVENIIKSQKPYPIPIEISAHHAHLCQHDVEALFGKGHTLTRLSDLSQPGQFACKEQVTLVGPKGKVERVRVLGPARKASQVEISMTEQFKLGIHPPVRESGDIEGTPGITLEAGGNQTTIEKGVICALRHIHMSTEDALRFGLKDKSRVQVRIEGGNRELSFGDVLIRVSPDFRLAMHIDTDEGNAAGVNADMVGYLEGVETSG